MRIKDRRTELEKLAFHLQNRNDLGWDESFSMARKLRRAGFIIERLEETACNRTLNHDETVRVGIERKRFKGYCESLGCEAIISDPRGFCAHIRFPSNEPNDDGPWNTMGGPEQGWGVTGR